MKNRLQKSTTLAFLVAGVMASGARVSTARAQSSDALVDALIKKGILTEQEAEDIKADLYKENKESHKLKLNSALKSLEIYGDARLRYEWRQGQDVDGDTYSRERFRYRVRLGLKGDYKDDWYYGLRLETGRKARSTNVTLGDSGDKPFEKENEDFSMRVGQVYLGWNATDWLNLEAGKIANPIVTTSMVWDGDINPEGATERFKYGLLEANKLNLFATFGQFLYDDRNPENPLGGVGGGTVSDAFMLAWQAGAKYQIDPKTSVQIAPVLYNYTGHGDAPLGSVFSATGAGGTSFAGINNLLVLEIPIECNFTLLDMPWKGFADFAVNLEGSDRRDAAVAAGQAPASVGDENLAYRIGLQVGSAKKKGTWQTKAFWQHQELFSLDPNLVDSDLFDSKLNLEGFVVECGYAITDSIKANATYAYADRIERKLGTGTGGDIAPNPMKRYQILQFDIGWKF
jgi:Putative porin